MTTKTDIHWQNTTLNLSINKHNLYQTTNSKKYLKLKKYLLTNIVYLHLNNMDDLLSFDEQFSSAGTISRSVSKPFWKHKMSIPHMKNVKKK